MGELVAAPINYYNFRSRFKQHKKESLSASGLIKYKNMQFIPKYLSFPL